MICLTFFPGAKHSRSYQSSKYAERNFLFRPASFAHGSCPHGMTREKVASRGLCRNSRKILDCLAFWFFKTLPGCRAYSPGGSTPLYKILRYVPPQCRFGLKTGIHFAHFGLESGMVFEGTTGLYERLYRFNSKRVRKKEKYANSTWI